MNILHLEDNPHDAHLVREILSVAWPEIAITLVATRTEFVGELERRRYDLILADYTLPSFNGLDALQCARELSPETPFVFLTGTLVEQRAIDAVERGATDYLLKGRLNRLVIVVRRAIRESRERQELGFFVERLRQSEERYRKVFAYSPLPIWITDSASQAFLDVNEAAVHHYGYSREEFCRLTLADLTISAPTALPSLAPSSSSVVRSFSGVRQHRKKDGSIIVVEVFSHEIDFDGGTARLMLLNDVTANRMAAEKIHQLNTELEQRVSERTARLEAAMKELEAFSYSVSHDLRSPLRGIDGFARALMEDHAGKLDPDGRHLVDTIRSEIRRMGQLIDDLLAFSRAGRKPLDTAPVDMTELARSAFQNIIEASPQRNVALQLQPLPDAIGDRALLRQVFANLLDNAVKFTARQPAPLIRLSGWSDAGMNTYCIKDNGVGFDPRFAHKLFGVFSRLHTQAEFAGTGVGLALVQRIVQRHGGKTWAESTLQFGANFYFTLPGVQHTPAPAAET